MYLGRSGRKQLRAFGPTLALSLFAAACTPTEGAQCSHEGRVSCQGTDAALVCAGGVYRRVHCRGRDGCLVGAAVETCDVGFASVGEVCGSASGGAACTPDKDALVRCSHYHIVPGMPCRGPIGCVVDSREVLCDQSIGVVGDPCEWRGAACSPDHASVLRCEHDTFVHDADCTGPLRCHADRRAHQVLCDGRQ